MSYRDPGNIAPHITSISPASFPDAGTFSITIDGTFFSPDMTVTVDSSLGTISGTPVITKPTPTTSRVVFSVVVVAESGTASREITLSNGGVSTADSVATVSHGFSIAALANETGSEAIWYDSSDLSKIQIDSSTTYNPQAVLQWDSSAGASVSQSSASGYSGHAAWPGAPTSPQIYGISRGQLAGLDSSVSGATFPSTIAGGNAFSVGMVVYIDQASIDTPIGTAYTLIHLRGHHNLSYSVGLNSTATGLQFHGNQAYKQASLGALYDITAAGSYTVIFVYEGSGTSGKLYINGTHEATQPNTLAYTASGYGIIDAYYQPNDTLLGDVFAINRALTASEITKLDNFWAAKYSIS